MCIIVHHGFGVCVCVRLQKYMHSERGEMEREEREMEREER